jgi:phage portal protein BeeE
MNPLEESRRLLEADQALYEQALQPLETIYIQQASGNEEALECISIIAGKIATIRARMMAMERYEQGGAVTASATRQGGNHDEET